MAYKKNRLRAFFIIILSIIFASLHGKAFAQSDYVLPYPAVMPGNKLYTVSLIKEKIDSFWYFGNLAQFTYNVKRADKYIVEAKTLFEYKQYLLGMQALQKSDAYFLKTHPSLLSAKKEGKDVSEKVELLKSAAEKHREILQTIAKDLPSEFIWTPEKEQSSHLELQKQMKQSIVVRESVL